MQGGDRWQNLYRLTDPIGGFVKNFEDDNGIDVRVKAPADLDALGTEIPVIRRHSDYFVEPEYHTAVATGDERTRLTPSVTP